MTVHIDYRVMHEVGLMFGYRFLEKFMFSFQTLHVLCKLQKFLPKYRIMWPMPSYLFLEFSNFFSNSSLGSEKLNQNRQRLFVYSASVIVGIMHVNE